MNNKLITIGNVRGYIDSNGVAQLNAEDVARGWGFTQVAKSGNAVVRWERVNGYLKEFGFIPTSGDDVGKDKSGGFSYAHFSVVGQKLPFDFCRHKQYNNYVDKRKVKRCQTVKSLGVQLMVQLNLIN